MPQETQVYVYSVWSGDSVLSNVSTGALDMDERSGPSGAIPQTLDTVHQVRGGGRAQPRIKEPLETQVYDYSVRSGDSGLSTESTGALDMDERSGPSGAIPQTMDMVHQVRGGGRAQPRTLEPQETQVYDHSDRSNVTVMSLSLIHI